MPVDWPLATGVEGEVVPAQGIPGEIAQAVALALRLLLIVLLLLDVAGMMPAKLGKCERNAKTSALAPTATTTTPMIAIRITFVMPPMAPFEAVIVTCAP